MHQHSHAIQSKQMRAPTSHVSKRDYLSIQFIDHMTICNTNKQVEYIGQNLPVENVIQPSEMNIETERSPGQHTTGRLRANYRAVFLSNYPVTDHACPPIQIHQEQIFRVTDWSTPSIAPFTSLEEHGPAYLVWRPFIMWGSAGSESRATH